VKRELSPQELRWAGFSLVGGLLLFGLAYFGTERLWSVEPLREKERTEFKKLFPNAPVRAVREQVLSKASKEESFQLSQKLSELSTKLSSDLKLYSL
jgi:predicted ATP-binding protein involved in virulence